MLNCEDDVNDLQCMQDHFNPLLDWQTLLITIQATVEGGEGKMKK